MSECPLCRQPVESNAIACPHCRTPLKAHGHPGMPLHRSTGGEPLCVTCTYDADDTCTFPKRPTAMDCTLYDDVRKPLQEVHYKSSFHLSTWVRRNAGLLALIGLVLLSLMVVLLR